MANTADIESFLYAELRQSRSSASVPTPAQDEGVCEIDSLEGVELVAAAEERFGVVVPDTELDSTVCSSIPLLAKLIATKLPSS